MLLLGHPTYHQEERDTFDLFHTVPHHQPPPRNCPQPYRRCPLKESASQTQPPSSQAIHLLDLLQPSPRSSSTIPSIPSRFPSLGRQRLSHKDLTGSACLHKPSRTSFVISSAGSSGTGTCTDTAPSCTGTAPSCPAPGQGSVRGHMQSKSRWGERCTQPTLPGWAVWIKST